MTRTRCSSVKSHLPVSDTVRQTRLGWSEAHEQGRRTTGHSIETQASPAEQDPCSPSSYGQFLKIQVSRFLPDPGALNSCMHTFPENNLMNTQTIARNHYSQLASHEGALSSSVLNLSSAIMGHHGLFLTTDCNIWFLDIMKLHPVRNCVWTMVLAS